MSPQLEAQLAEKMAELQSMMKSAGMNGGAAPGNGLPAWLAPPAAAAGGVPTPIGFSVPIEIQMQGPTGYGTVTVDLAFPAEAWTQAPQIVQALQAQGYKVKVWTPKPAGFGGGYPPRGGGFGGGGSGWGR